MKVASIIWIAAVAIALMVAGRSLELVLLSTKIVFFGFILGFVGAKISDAIHAYLDVRAVISKNLR